MECASCRRDWSSGHELVAAQIENAEGNGTARKHLVGLAVDMYLLFQRREGVTDDEGELGAIEADALGAVFSGDREVRGDADVRVQRHAHTVRGAGEDVAKLRVLGPHALGVPALLL